MQKWVRTDESSCLVGVKVSKEVEEKKKQTKIFLIK